MAPVERRCVAQKSGLDPSLRRRVLGSTLEPQKLWRIRFSEVPAGVQAFPLRHQCPPLFVYRVVDRQGGRHVTRGRLVSLPPDGVVVLLLRGVYPRGRFLEVLSSSGLRRSGSNKGKPSVWCADISAIADSLLRFILRYRTSCFV